MNFSFIQKTEKELLDDDEMALVRDAIKSLTLSPEHIKQLAERTIQQLKANDEQKRCVRQIHRVHPRPPIRQPKPTAANFTLRWRTMAAIAVCLSFFFINT